MTTINIQGKEVTIAHTDGDWVDYFGLVHTGHKVLAGLLQRESNSIIVHLACEYISNVQVQILQSGQINAAGPRLVVPYDFAAPIKSLEVRNWNYILYIREWMLAGEMKTKLHTAILGNYASIVAPSNIALPSRKDVQALGGKN